MYMRVWDMVKIANDPTETRPLILCEYDFIFLHQQHSMTLFSVIDNYNGFYLLCPKEMAY